MTTAYLVSVAALLLKEALYYKNDSFTLDELEDIVDKCRREAITDK